MDDLAKGDLYYRFFVSMFLDGKGERSLALQLFLRSQK